jgi:death on curing protein
MTKGKEPKWLLSDAVIAMHRMLVAEHGGSPGLRDRGLLESALARPRNRFAYAKSRPTLPTLAAAYAYGIVKNHPFVDGNKRVALTAATVFLEVNGATLKASEAEIVVVFRNLAAGGMSEREMASWFRSNVRDVQPRSGES